MQKFKWFILSLFFVGSLQAQLKIKTHKGTPTQHLEPVKHLELIKKFANPNNSNQYFIPNSLGSMNTGRIHRPIIVHQKDKNQMPILIKGVLDEPHLHIERQSFQYLEAIAPYYRIENANQEWEINKIERDDIGMDHIFVQQIWQNIPVYNAELRLHAKNGKIYSVNGQGFPSPKIETITPGLTKKEAERKIQNHLAEQKKFKEISQLQLSFLKVNQFDSELIIYHNDGDHRMEMLAYHIKVYENLGTLTSFFIDAHSGEIIDSFGELCKLHHDFSEAPPDGPAMASALDLNGVTRTINTYEVGSDYYLIDGNKPMFRPSVSVLPNEPVGVIWTLNAFDTSPSNDDFSYDHIKSANNTWNHPTAVSAHFNAGIAYNYFKDVHGRESINGEGGNIISFINVSDEDGVNMDNAFWNGVAMWYGNGKDAFKPLAGGLDVAGHEMTHGVVQSSANLEYQGESGAINESFADVFAVMMDRDDYQIGEDVVFSTSFPTGALRDLENPNNGGSQLGDNGWQPHHTSDQYFGEEDKGGVHINSGIPNHAFYQFAQLVGKEKAEQVYYRALTLYLTRSSQFVDLRNAVVQSTDDLFGVTEVSAANNAFDIVGIAVGDGGNYQNDIETNPGDDFLIYADDTKSLLRIANNNLELVFDPATEVDPLSKPSVTDDGSIVVFVNTDNQIHALFIDWTQGTLQETVIQEQEIWGNVVISKDGNRMAAVELAEIDRIQVYDFSIGAQGAWYEALDGQLGFPLYNPTFTEGVSTGDVQYADAMEFDVTGEILMYDAYSEIDGSGGQTIGYWDIGFLDVFNNQSGFWSNGNIIKLFSQLEEGISVGNPTFAKNSPYIVAFDYLDGQEFSILGVNIETGDIKEIFENSGPGYPSYNSDDSQLIFTNEGLLWVDIGIVQLNADKISRVINSEGILIADAQLGVAFSNGNRPLSSSITEIPGQLILISIAPNPVSNQLNFTVVSDIAAQGNIQISDLNGKIILTDKIFFKPGQQNETRDISRLPAGNYILQLNTKKSSESVLFNKI